MASSSARLFSLRPVGTPIDGETVEALEALLEAARRGAVTGIAFVAALSASSVGRDFWHGEFLSDMAGRCREKPSMTRGMVAYLEDQVASLQHRHVE